MKHQQMLTKIGKTVFQKCKTLTTNKIHYSEGSRNAFVHLLANNCNRHGIPEIEALPFIKK